MVKIKYVLGLTDLKKPILKNCFFPSFQTPSPISQCEGFFPCQRTAQMINILLQLPVAMDFFPNDATKHVKYIDLSHSQARKGFAEAAANLIF